MSGTCKPRETALKHCLGSLLKHKTLKTLLIADNTADKAASNFLKLIKETRNIRHIDLSNTDFSEADCKKII